MPEEEGMTPEQAAAIRACVEDLLEIFLKYDLVIRAEHPIYLNVDGLGVYDIGPILEALKAQNTPPTNAEEMH